MAVDGAGLRVIALLLRCGSHLEKAVHALEVLLGIAQVLVGLVERLPGLGEIFSPGAVGQQVELRLGKVHAAFLLAQLDVQVGMVDHGKDVSLFHVRALVRIEVEYLSR